MSDSEDYCTSSSNQKKIGPELPPNFKIPELSELDTSRSSLQREDLPVIINSEDKSDSYGPTLPSKITQKNYICGPNLPPNLKKRQLSELETSDSTESPKHIKSLIETTVADENSESYGPALPPHLIKARKDNVVEPRLPTIETTESSEDDECYGPLPPNTFSHSKAHIALEERALQMKIDSLHGDVKNQITREEWMTELPEVHSRNLGLGPRQFRANPAPDLSDRSSWTDTPKDKAKKAQDKQPKKTDLKKEAEIKEQRKYDKEQEKIIKRYKKQKKKEESLLDIHQRNLNKKKTEEGNTRRPFNRDIDLKVNHFDEAQKKAILKKAQFLDDRFSSGHSKFL